MTSRSPASGVSRRSMLAAAAARADQPPVALAVAVLQISDSPTALGVVLAAHSIPMVVFLLVGGVLAAQLGAMPKLLRDPKQYAP